MYAMCISDCSVKSVECDGLILQLSVQSAIRIHLIQNEETVSFQLKCSDLVLS